MKTIIKWTTQDIEGKIAVMALAKMMNIEDMCCSFSIDTEKNLPFILFDTFSEAKQYIEQIKKPEYYNLYGSNYEVMYCDPESEVWNEIYDIFQNTVNTLRSIEEEYQKEISQPFWKRILKIFS